MTADARLIAGRYRLEQQIGAGAMGVVWRAHDIRLDRTVAVKQLLIQPGLSEAEREAATARAMREGRIAARLQHPHAISVYDVALDDIDDPVTGSRAAPWLIMEYLPSRSLAAILTDRGTLPPRDVARIGRQVAAALAAAHRAGIVHRDVKPGNVLISEDGIVKITDFGISRATWEAAVTRTGVVAGTPAYFAPEVARGEPRDPPADVFSLGSTLYAAVEGKPPFGLDDNTLALLRTVAEGRVRPPLQAGPLSSLLMRMLREDPVERPSMSDAVVALGAVAHGGSRARPVRRPSTLPPSTLPPSTLPSASGPNLPVIPVQEIPPKARTTRQAAVPVSTARGGTAGQGRGSRQTPWGRDPVSAGNPAVAGNPPPGDPPTAEPSTGSPSTGSPSTGSPSTGSPSTGDPPPGDPPPGDPLTTDPAADRRRQRALLLGAAICLIILLGALAFAAAGPQDRQADNGQQPPTTAAPPASAPIPLPALPGPAELEQTVRTYYGLLPDDAAAAWEFLGAAERAKAGGLAGYLGFWNEIDEVRIRGPVAVRDNVVVVTLEFDPKGRGRTLERYQLTMGTAADGRVQIESSSLISSLQADDDDRGRRGEQAGDGG